MPDNQDDTLVTPQIFAGIEAKVTLTHWQPCCRSDVPLYIVLSSGDEPQYAVAISHAKVLVSA